MLKLAGKTAVITHATFGVALAGARLFVDEGAYVFITGKYQKLLDQAVKEIGKNVTGIVCDTGDINHPDLLSSTLLEHEKSIDILFVCLEQSEFATIGQIKTEHFQRTTNAVQTFLSSIQKAFSLINAGGTIIVCGSASAIRNDPAFSVYNAGQVMMRFFAGVWCKTLRSKNIRVNILSPGKSEADFSGHIQEWAEDCFEESFSGTIGEAEVIAARALYLASADSMLINGIELFAEGGSFKIGD